MTLRGAEKLLFSFYDLCWNAATPFLRKNTRISDGIGQRTLTSAPLPQASIWIQSASAGESYLAWEILKQLDISEPMTVLLTSGTRQGIDILEQAAAQLKTSNPFLTTHVSFFPFDRPRVMEKAVKLVNPKLMVLVELEIWPGLLLALKQNGSKILIVNGRLTERSLKRYRLVPSLWKALEPESVLAISKGDAERFRALFPGSRVRMVPNIKFDRLPRYSSGSGDHSRHSDFQSLSGKPVIVLGSVRQEEEPMIESIIIELVKQMPGVVIGLFPRHMHRTDHWASRLTAMGMDWVLRSSYDNQTPQVILWDVFGELTLGYSMATTAFVGGSLVPLGGQNFLEALGHGVIPISGPHWDNFSWVGDGIVDSGLLDIGETWEQVAEKLIRNSRHPMDRESVKKKTEDYIDEMRGGTETTCDEIIRLIQLKGHP